MGAPALISSHHSACPGSRTVSELATVQKNSTLTLTSVQIRVLRNG